MKQKIIALFLAVVAHACSDPNWLGKYLSDQSEPATRIAERIQEHERKGRQAPRDQAEFERLVLSGFYLEPNDLDEPKKNILASGHRAVFLTDVPSNREPDARARWAVLYLVPPKGHMKEDYVTVVTSDSPDMWQFPTSQATIRYGKDAIDLLLIKRRQAAGE